LFLFNSEFEYLIICLCGSYSSDNSVSLVNSDVSDFQVTKLIKKTLYATLMRNS